MQTDVNDLIKKGANRLKESQRPCAEKNDDDADGVIFWETLDEALYSCQRTIVQMDETLVGL